MLLYGPPGTGKTLLARAVAGEAGVPFFSISGSDFVEMFVGVGASRVRDLFEQAKQASPCIVFMDEIDAVGRHRGAGLGGGNDEREQTLNQLLVEMDGFEMKDNIILIAATNRPDILDPALLRPGRFDRQIVVDRPDRNGRRKILEVHSKGKPLAPAIDLDALAAGTPGSRAPISQPRQRGRAARGAPRQEGDRAGGARGGDHAGDRRPEKKARLLSEKEQRITAYHEMGHALVGHFLENTDPMHKITVVSRGQALGLTISLPTEDRYLTTRKALLEQIAMTLGGRAAEELVFNEVTTGASNDIEKVTSTAKQMVMRFGMSEKLGPRVLGRNHDMPFLGRDMGNEPDYSDEVAREIDDEIRRIIEEGHDIATRVLREHLDDLHRISQILIERETIDKDQFERLLAGEPEDAVFPPPEPTRRRRAGAEPRAAPADRSRGRSRFRAARPCSRPSPKRRKHFLPLQVPLRFRSRRRDRARALLRCPLGGATGDWTARHRSGASALTLVSTASSGRGEPAQRDPAVAIGYIVMAALLCDGVGRQHVRLRRSVYLPIIGARAHGPLLARSSRPVPRDGGERRADPRRRRSRVPTRPPLARSAGQPGSGALAGFTLQVPGRRRLERSCRASRDSFDRQRKTQFLPLSRHELRTPLNAPSAATLDSFPTMRAPSPRRRRARRQAIQRNVAATHVARRGSAVRRAARRGAISSTESTVDVAELLRARGGAPRGPMAVDGAVLDLRVQTGELLAVCG